MADEPKEANAPKVEAPAWMTVREFFERTPPGREVRVKDLVRQDARGTGVTYHMRLIAIELFCTSESCNGVRFFEPKDDENLWPEQRREHFVTFVCRNCKESRKTYAFWSLLDKDGSAGALYKFGEHPPFGPPTPARLISLIGPERDYFLKGRRSENQGLGIAAFAYYRRVIENQKNRIFDEIIRVCQKLGAAQEIVDDLDAAKQETQFTKAVEAIKHGVPQAILINGQNPVLLLHAALSEGLHAQTDEECLELARSIRVVLTELVERLAAALKEEAELNAAVSRLLRARAGKAENKGDGG